MLPAALRTCGLAVDTVLPRRGWPVRGLGKLWSWINGLPPRHQSLAFAEWEFLRKWRHGGATGLIASIEDHWPLLSLRRFELGTPPGLIGVIHFPPPFWSEFMLAALRRLRSALVLYRADIPFFERHVGEGRVRFVPHGVDTSHFTPLAGLPGRELRLLVSGQFGRDFQLLGEAYPRIRASFPACTLDLIGAHHARVEPAVRRLAAMPGVAVHGLLPDGELVERYRRATLLLLPLREAGANNALVEALACGVPVLATDVGGVRDYGGGMVFPVVPPRDAEAFAHAANSLLTETERRRAIGQACRRFAEENLAWSNSARRHREAIASLLGA